MTFSLPLDLQRLPEGRSEQVLMTERLEEMATQAAHLFAAPHPLAAISDQLTSIAAKLTLG